MPATEPTHATPPTGAPAEVFSINFVRGRAMPAALRRSLLYAAVGYVVLNVVVAAGLVVSGIGAQAEWSRIQGTTSSSTPIAAQKQEIEVLRQRAAADLAQLEAVAKLSHQRFTAGEKLDALTTTIPARTWITNAVASRDGRTLKIDALYLIDPQRPYDLPTKPWIDGLRADSRFSKKLKRLEMGETSRKSQGEAQLFSFSLIAEWN